MSGTPQVGKLDTILLPDLFRIIYCHNLTGKLDLQSKQDQRRILFFDGEIRSARSNRVEQRIGNYLVRQEVIEENALEGALQQKSKEEPLGQTLMKLGLVTAGDLVVHLKELVREIIFESFGWTKGMCCFTEGQVSLKEEVQIPVSTADIIYQGFKRFAPDHLIQKILGNLKDPLTPNPNVNLQHLSLQPNEVYILGQINGQTNPETLVKLIPGDKNENFRICASLLASGFISRQGTEPCPSIEIYFQEKTESEPEEQVERSREKKKKKVKWIRPPKREVVFTERDITLMRQKIMDKYRKINMMNYYDLLECPLKATQKEIHFAFLNLCSFYHPDLTKKEPFKDLYTQLDAIFHRMEEAYKVLVDYEQRMRYDRTVIGRR